MHEPSSARSNSPEHLPRSHAFTCARRVSDAAQAEVERALECDALDRFLESVHGRFAALALRDPNGTFFEGDVLVRVH